mgnify:CR=1 FL=1
MYYVIFLAGGAGYIGSHTAVELLNEGYEVLIADNYSNSSPKVINRIQQITGRLPLVKEIDVSDINEVDSVFSEYRIEAVIHFAGYKAVGESVKEPLKYYKNNLNTTLTLLEIMLKHQVRKLVFSSSATVYGIPQKLPLTEDMPTSATNPYGQTKLMIEHILRDISSTCPHMAITLLRYFNPVGAHESGLIGESPNGIPNNLMPYVAQVALGKLEKLHVYGNDYPTIDGTGVRDYIHVVDLARGHLAALRHLDNHPGLTIYNLGTGTPSSVLEIVSVFEQVSKREIPYVIVPRRQGDVAECYADTSKAWKELKWKAERDLEDMCRDTWRWQQQNPNGFHD